MKKILSVLLLMIAAVPYVSGQTSKGIVAGVVRDNSGAAVPNASVKIVSQDTGEERTVTTTGEGAYRVDAINPGRYKIRVEMPGFTASEVNDLRVLPSVVTTYDPKLAVGSVNDTVTVEAETNAINTENGQLSGTVGTQELSKVPIFSLNPFELVATLPGVVLINPNLNLNGTAGNYEQIQVNGARPRSNNFMLDGQDINDVGIGGQSFNPQIPDMYQTVTTLLNSASAEYGRSGGAVVNLITKSGTNQFHGSLFELYSGSGLESLDGVTRQQKPIPAGTPNPKARFDEHQFGFTAGGPIWKDKLFAFGGTQFTRFYGKSPSDQILLPTQAGYNQLATIAASSTTAASQVALFKSLLNGGSYLTTFAQAADSSKTLAVSAANCGGTACAIPLAFFQRAPVSQEEPDTQWEFRVDFIPRSNDTFSYRYLHDRSTFTPDLGLNVSGIPGFDAQEGGPAELAQGTWTHVFTPNLLNEFRASEVRLSSQFFGTPETLANPAAQIFNVTIAGSGFNTLGVSQNIPQGRIQQLYQFQDTVAWTKGRQSIRMGTDVARDHETDLIAQNALGQITYATGGAGASSFDNFISNQLGSGGTITRTFGPTRVDPHLWKIAGFIQDDIKLTPEFTLNVGVRYDYDTNPENSLTFPSVDVKNPYQAINTVVPVKADKNNFAPRVGFAYNPHFGFFSDGKTVIHAGLGIFYDVDFTNIIVNSAQSSPVAPTGLITGATSNGFGPNATTLLTTLTPALTAQSSVLSTSNNMVNPMTYQYNLGFERQLPAAIKLTVNYVGANGKKLFVTQQLNPFSNGVRLNPARGAVTVRNNGGDSNYNSAQVEVSRAFTHGISFRASYSFSKNLDDASEIFSTFSNPNTPYGANLQRQAQEYSNSTFDRRHIASFEYIFAPSGFHSANRGADLLLEAFTRHFIVSGTTQLASGPYSSFQIVGIDTSGDLNASNDRPIVGNSRAPITSVGIDGAYVDDPTAVPGVYYDLAANNATGAVTPITADQARFLIPNGSQFITREVGRNSFENPGQIFWNLAAEKDIPASFRHFEHAQFVLRAEGQNVGNHNNVSILDTNLIDVGTSNYLNKQNARENTSQNFRLWAKFIF
ncbi:TonB-dependent receptor [Terriglobus saanensis]|uniref:TonB-dependent receptor plug n=1 Tax=Terriglobus saanensis (strain ATCC BAA-1853 / DSM 23119 / SP1PR4) TaxID=401053 RepID=E8V596_TERSS|nr:carboxypeptidase regulatory-like domain-containing protein [Terriglobus saanensis]ADV84855.1 TonB-dependent receptor plug [Terriglobus saanensis SP1PR4]